MGRYQNDSVLPVFSAELEENGPMRSVVKVTASSTVGCANYKSETCKFPLQHCVDGEQVQVQHGFAVRIYAYAGQSFVKVDYQLRNSPFSKVVNGYALYFDEVGISLEFSNLKMRIDYSLALSSSSTVTVGKGDGTVWTSAISSQGYQLYQDFPVITNNVYRIRDATTFTNTFTGNISDGFMDVSFCHIFH
jgi:hypothetical protein